jgi:hypothetical protein
MRKNPIPILAGVMLLIGLTLAWKGSIIPGWVTILLVPLLAALIVLDFWIMDEERKRRAKQLEEFKVFKL